MLSISFRKAVLALAVSSGVGTVQAADVIHYTASGEFANAGTVEYGADGCSMKEVWVGGDSRAVKQTPGAPQDVMAGWINGRFIDWCAGKEEGFSGFLDNASISVAKGLKIATLSATGVVYKYSLDWGHGHIDYAIASIDPKPIDPPLPPPPSPTPQPEPLPPPTPEKVSVNVSWTATGDVVRGTYSTRQSFGGTSFSYTSRGSTRDAVAQGSIVMESQEINFDTDGGKGYAMIGESRDSQRTLIRY